MKKRNRTLQSEVPTPEVECSQGDPMNIGKSLLQVPILFVADVRAGSSESELISELREIEIVDSRFAGVST